MPIRSDPTPRPTSTDSLPGLGSLPERPARSLPALVPPAHGGPGGPAGRPAARPAPRRPDPTSARFAVAAGGIATFSALLAAIAGASIPATTVATTPPTVVAAAPGQVQTVVKYVYVQPGRPAPTAGLATVVAPPAPRPVPAPVVTRQSGKP